MSELYTKYATEQYVDNNLNIGLETKADAEHNHDSSYDVKGAANTALNSAKEYVDEAVSSLGTIIATDENSDGNIVLRPYVQEEDFIQVDKTLSIEGAAADAKAVGDRLQNLNVDMATIEVSDPNDDGNVVLTQLGGEFIDDYLTAEEANTMFAPSGYIANVIDIASESELDTALTNIITNMPDLTERHVVFQDNAGLFNGGFTLARIFTRVGTYATATFETYGYYGYTKWVKNCYGGSWYPLEWENPPMILGVEYRTTERHNGKVVYAKYYDAGILMNNTLYSLPSGAKDIVRMQAYTSKGHLLPVGPFIKDDPAVAYFAYAVTNAGANGVCGFTDTRTDGFGNGSYNMYIKLWYTKD